MTLTSDRPVVLIAEELAPSAIEVLADDFDVRHVDGTDRPALLADGTSNIPDRRRMCAVAANIRPRCCRGVRASFNIATL